MVVLTLFLLSRGGHESKDTDEKFEKFLNEIKERLDHLEKSLKNNLN